MTKAVIVGCGNIATHYARDLMQAGVVDLVGFHDVSPDRARLLADEHGARAYETIDEALAAADLVINLTIFEAHYPVSKAALEAGCHVYSEKPLALRLEHARELVDIATAGGLRLGAAPFTFLGEAQATAIEWIQEGRLGSVRVAFAEVNHGRIETWHPNPAPFYEVGPMLDVGVYPLAILTAGFGPVRTVRASSSIVQQNRTDMEGNPFSPGSPDYWLVELVHTGGERVRLTVNFYVKGAEGIEFHGDDGSLALESWFDPDSSLIHTPYEGQPERVDFGTAPDRLDWSTGVVSFVAGLETGDSPINASSALHMVEVLSAIEESGQSGTPVDLSRSG